MELSKVEWKPEPLEPLFKEKIEPEPQLPLWTGSAPPCKVPPIKPAPPVKERSPRTGTNKRLSPRAVQIFNDWLNENLDDPYPTKEMKVGWVKETGLQEKQINYYFTNYRRRKLKRHKRNTV